MHNKSGYEIERKFLIAMPSEHWLNTVSDRKLEILQTYLLSDEIESARVRQVVENGVSSFYYTIKKKISMIKRLETESEITKEMYENFLKKSDPSRRRIQKVRYCVPYQNHVFEIDIFPFWNDKAFLEVELSSESEMFSLPPEICVLREVTEDKRYTNAALAKEIPE